MKMDEISRKSRMTFLISLISHYHADQGCLLKAWLALYQNQYVVKVLNAG